jgi:hypothetical protein
MSKKSIAYNCWRIKLPRGANMQSWNWDSIDWVTQALLLRESPQKPTDTQLAHYRHLLYLPRGWFRRQGEGPVSDALVLF